VKFDYIIDYRNGHCEDCGRHYFVGFITDNDCNECAHLSYLKNGVKKGDRAALAYLHTAKYEYIHLLEKPNDEGSGEEEEDD
jgi:hypothetical protein